MCLTSEAVDELHAITSAIKAEQERRDQWLKFHANAEITPLDVSQSEAERIFADRIAAHEARLKELGWRKLENVAPGDAGDAQRIMTAR